MCEVLDKVEARGFKRGEKRGRLLTLKELVDAGILTMEEAAKRANMSVENFSKKVC